MTAQEVFMISMSLADELQDTPNIQVDATSTNSYRVRTPGILTALQAELIKTGSIFNSFEISNKPLQNMLGFNAGREYLEFVGQDIIKEAQGSVKAYYFEVDGEATVFIEDFTTQWNVLAQIDVSSTVSAFTSFKGIVAPTEGATRSRLRFSGNYRYLITNYALFDVPLQADRVPDYRPWVPKVMPIDFKELDQVIEEKVEGQYSRATAYKWEGRNKLFIDYSFEGKIRIVYRPVPNVVSAMTDELQVDDVTARTLLPYGLAAELFKEENPDIYNHFIKRYHELKALAEIKQPASEQAIIDIYGLGGAY